MTSQTLRTAAICVVLSFLVGCARDDAAPGQPGATGQAPAKTLTIWWAQWAPADGLQELANEYSAETGVKVDVHQIPWSNFQKEAFLEFGSKETKFDILIGDSQWIGHGATKGLYVDLTDWLPTAVDMSTVHPRAAKYLCEYPPGSGKFFAAPCETDAVGICYRKDWFEDEGEREAFQEKYGRELAAPDTWEEFRDIADFFTRPQEKRYGCAILTGRSYDSLVMGYQHFLWAFGGAWSNEDRTKVQGSLNSEGGIAGLEFMKSLLPFSPNGGENLDYGGTPRVFVNGSVAMAMNYFAFFPDISRTMGDKVGFCPIPRQGDIRAVSLGGQGFSISTKVPAERQQAAREFISWFLKEEQQKKWITKDAGFTANTAILNSPEFAAASPYNAAFASSLDYVQDFWNVPVFGKLLAPAQRHLGEALDGAKTAKEALDAIAEEHEQILRDAGLIE